MALLATNAELTSEVEDLRRQLDWLKRQLFGAKSERPGQNRFGWEWTRFIALDAATGREAWRSEPLFHPSATSSSVGLKITNGREEMAVIVSDGGAMLRAEDGRILSQTWLIDAGQGTPTVGGSSVYHVSEAGLLAVSRAVMHDRDSAGLQRIWLHKLPTGFDKRVVGFQLRNDPSRKLAYDHFFTA